MSIRCFIAIELEAGIIRALAECQRGLKSQVDLPVKWVNPEGIHLTLKFLGAVEESRIEGVRASLARAAAGARSFALELAGPGVFPNARRPRVLWIGLEGDVAALQELQQRVEREMNALGFPSEERPFTPHLTLGRVREDAPRGTGLAQSALDSARPARGLVQAVNRVSLMKSDLRPQGAIYTRLAEILLPGPGPL